MTTDTRMEALRRQNQRQLQGWGARAGNAQRRTIYPLYIPRCETEIADEFMGCW